MNGGFEDENICMEYQKNCAPEGWISTSLYADYYFDDQPHAFEGRHFTGLVLGNKDKPQLRNFLRTRLLCGLRKGAKYSLQFSFRSLHRSFDSVGIYFSAADFLYQRERIASGHPQLFLRSDSNLKASADWQKVSFVYTATGDENFLNIGDFSPRGHEFKNDVPDLARNFYFFLDDFSLTPLDPKEKLCGDAEKVKEDEYNFDPRHDKLDRLIYYYTKNPPPVEPLTKTALQRIDTLVIPDVLFATSSYTLNAKASVVLDSFIQKATSLKVDSIVVEGHTDNQGNSIANQRLSENRAGSVAGYLQPHLQTVFVTRGWASNKPVADNHTAAGRQQNRRVEIYFYVRE
jgi:outer membrane protein OmpA-like peptidoglycan-associated protein